MPTNTERLARIIGEAAPLIAVALSDVEIPQELMFSYSEYAVIVRPINTDASARRFNKASFAVVDAAFQGAGWERRISFTGGNPRAEVHAFVPGWLPRL
jgi:hypothetical protein